MTILFFAPTFAPSVACHFTQDSPCLAILSPNKMTAQMKSIQFSLVHTYDRKKQTDKNGQGLIWVVAYQSGKHKYYNTDVRVRPDQWSRKRACVLRYPNAAAYNAKLNAKVAELANYQVHLINSKFGEHIKLEEFDDKYRNSEAGTLTFTSFYEVELEKDDLKRDRNEAFPRLTLIVLQGITQTTFAVPSEINNELKRYLSSILPFNRFTVKSNQIIRCFKMISIPMPNPKIGHIVRF